MNVPTHPNQFNVNEQRSRLTMRAWMSIRATTREWQQQHARLHVARVP